MYKNKITVNDKVRDGGHKPFSLRFAKSTEGFPLVIDPEPPKYYTGGGLWTLSITRIKIYTFGHNVD